MFLNNVKYILSAPSSKYWPDESKKEICIVGRSNVGKSTLINKMTNNRNMAKVSKTPGLTKYLNFFDVNNSYSLVDTPGYGYAKASRNRDESFANMMHEYIYNRKSLICIYVIIDSKIGFTDDDILLLDMAKDAYRDVVIVTSKYDKLNQKMKHQLKMQVKELNQTYEFKDVIYYSSFDNSYEKVVISILETYKNYNL